MKLKRTVLLPLTALASKFNLIGLGENPVLPLPEPEKNPIKPDYRAGDKALSLEEFATLLESDYDVSGNMNAENPDKFNLNPIFVYGEYHIESVMPSIPQPGQGALLLEQNSLLESDLDKYNVYATLCENIDSKEFMDELRREIEKTLSSGAELLRGISPEIYHKFHNDVNGLPILKRNNSLHLLTMLKSRLGIGRIKRILKKDEHKRAVFSRMLDNFFVEYGLKKPFKPIWTEGMKECLIIR